MTTTVQLPAQMKAWIWSKAARTISLSMGAAIPSLGRHDVLIANKAIGLNPVDWKFIETDRGDLWTDGHIPGVDGAGVVVAVGDKSNEHWLGISVCYHQSLQRSGSFAEYTAIDHRTLIRLPEMMARNQAAAFPCPVMTAWQAIEKIPIQHGAEILITGASGAVGRMLVQLADVRGFKVTAIASLKRHEALFALGANVCVECTEQLLQKFYAIFDTVSGEHAEELASRVEANGHLICIMGRLEKAAVPGFSTAISQHEVALNALHGSGTSAQWRHFTQEAEKLINLVNRGEFKSPDIYVARFEQIADALREFKCNRKALKYVVEVE
ncbi:alcohol dehydrogenase catalytic domain-containing protein [Shewanella zhangzhouensis]|uniref:alcohol dehydrogenase catalytic domain-containing protein n=1 Tax=Shewanella zhangzhouensis TaxID=2864213 RepID=UPI003D9C87BF